jgi:hypothetical protein
MRAIARIRPVRQGATLRAALLRNFGNCCRGCPRSELTLSGNSSGMSRSKTAINPVMRAETRAFDWASTSIGPAERWPASLHTVLDLALDTEFAMMIMWGPDLIQLYNDGYIPILGDKHPRSIGQRAQDCWSAMIHRLGSRHAKAGLGYLLDPWC